jgi:hypothetical protein
MIKSNDGPTKRQLNYMKNYDLIARPTRKNNSELADFEMMREGNFTYTICLIFYLTFIFFFCIL